MDTGRRAAYMVRFFRCPRSLAAIGDSRRAGRWASHCDRLADQLASLALAGFGVLAAFLFHANFGDRNQMLHFEKDLAIAGGFLVLFARGGGAWALDALRSLVGRR